MIGPFMFVGEGRSGGLGKRGRLALRSRVRLVGGQVSGILGLLRPPERPSPTLTVGRSGAFSARAMIVRV